MINIMFEIIFEIPSEYINSRLSRDEERIGELESKFKEIIQSVVQRAKEAKNMRSPGLINKYFRQKGESRR